MISLIVACDQARGIGHQNKIPWFIPGELAWLKQRTCHTQDPRKQNALLMGYRTWCSLPPDRRPLPGRRSVVLSRTQQIDHPDVYVYRELSLAIKETLRDPRIETIFIFGGASIYQQALDMNCVDEIWLSLVDGFYPADTFFPALPAEFALVSSEPVQYGESRVHHQHWRRHADDATSGKK